LVVALCSGFYHRQIQFKFNSDFADV